MCLDQGESVMWKLLVLSYVFATADTMEPKVTRIAEFETKQECYVEWYKLTSEFTQGETAWCEGPK